MRIRASVQGPEIDAYIITTYDEHQSDETAESDRRLQYISGFTGPSAEVAVITIDIKSCYWFIYSKLI